MKVKGKVFSGIGRGEGLMEKYSPRLKNILGLDPYKGTLNIKMEKKVKISDISSKALEHLLVDGRKHVDAYFVKVKVIFNGKEKECWAMNDASGVYDDYVAELVAENSIMQELGIKDGDEIEIEFPDIKKKSKLPGIDMMDNFLKEHRKGV